MKRPRFGWLPGRDGHLPLRTLFDCALYKINLRLTCRSCGHSTVVDAPGLWWLAERRSWPQAIGEFGHRFYCGPCWRKLGVMVREPDIAATSDAPTGPLLPGPDRRQWKRITSRYRA